ncbi:extracellular solute-binding protein [Tabrizicola sp.]|uniref:extracellular solute-binding protein n=1 Tax=Tabrizicola sp. TaxID=2005166 RepID=UPI00260F0716|nr:extracellular solute-binding protein [Tabrizicola sp.]MDM7931003.1 extracellular solute-binding protein [Tabrizicola sp.]
MYGQPALPPDFVSLPQANPDAPKGGSITFAVNGSYDTLNPFITNGSAAEGIAPLTFETLMARSFNEPFTLYGLLAESITTDDGRTFVEFTLREAARFSDGSPVTVEDVLWSYETLGTLGHPRYHGAWKKIATAEATGPRSLRFTFNVEDRELPLILGLRPILKKADFDGKAFDVTSLDRLTGSGPYLVDKVDPGVNISYRRNPDWWGKDLPVNQGQWNFDTIRYEYFGNPVAVFESVKNGAITAYREDNLAKWASRYDFPAITSGEMVKLEVPHDRPSGIIGLVMNTRRAQFADWRVREAMIQMFNFDFINQTVTGGAAPRIASYFSNSPFAMTPGTPAEGKVLALLEPFAADLLPGTIEGYALPENDGTPANRAALRRAMALLEDAGWTVAADGILRNAEGAPFSFEILLTIGQDEAATISAIYVEALKAIGIDAKVTMLDSAQMKTRTDTFDFDMTYMIRTMSLSPGNEQFLYWGSDVAEAEGSRNWMGVKSSAIDAMIGAMLSAGGQDDFTAAAQALDRLLTAGRYVVPFWFADRNLIVHRKELRHPETVQLYGDWGNSYLPALWWYEE